ncbi:hypothetical protein C1H76_0110 [Elsinoe australis]|uniref:Alcohol acetyltransferase n=1 Tax=Elsinoe australis TaxID=40998 RepID=A0A4U7BG40_9PEZI|nr:hypothetical protein C1H76_0110 [Elsinoe australis]
MATQNEFLRLASPNEQRTISREDLGLYHAVIVGAVYKLSEGLDVTSTSTHFQPLRHCVDRNPYLSVVTGGNDTDKAYYERVPSVDLSQHIQIIQNTSTDSDDLSAMQQVITSDLDRPFPPGIPPWRTLILPLSNQRLFLAFAFSHSIGDGTTGLIFHRTFLEGLSLTNLSPHPSPNLVSIPSQPLPPPFDTPTTLSISYRFLLSTILTPLLPTPLTSLLNLSTTDPTPTTWTGALHPLTPPHSHHSKVHLFILPPATLAAALHECRAHTTTLTALLTHLIARSIASSLPSGTQATDLISETAINLRRAAGVSLTEAGNFVSVVAERHACGAFPRGDDAGAVGMTEAEWEKVKGTSRALAEKAGTLRDQAVGLLRYVSSVRKWVGEKLGQRRGVSFEVSNLGVFDAGVEEKGKEKAGIEEVVFAQPGMVAGPALAFNLVSVKGGGLVGSVTWSEGALGLEKDEGEAEFVRRVCEGVRRGLEEVGSGQ